MKRTELGHIPCDWIIDEWGTVLEGFTSGATPYRAIKSYYEGYIRWITSGELNYNVIYDTVEHISEVAKEHTNLTMHPAGTFLMAITGLEAEGTRGSCGIIGRPSTTNQSCMAIYGTDKLNVLYLYYFYLKYGKKFAKHYCQGTKQQSYTAQIVKKLPIAYPMNIDEQVAIVEVLSDVDSLIVSLKKLISKKKSIKQGAMQELLTGKIRLPGFGGEWEKKSFADVFEYMPTNALTREQMNNTGTVKNIHYGDILTKYGECLDAKDSMIPYIGDDRLVKKYTAFSYVQSGDIIIADTAEDNTVGKAVEIINVNCKMLSGQHTMLCRPKIKFAERFLGYYVNSDNFHNQMIPYITGIKVSSISKSSMSLLDIQIPSIKEQEEIAKIFSDMDQEIEHLEKKLAKYQQMKQGMLHELLTGHIRLIDAKDQEENETQISKEKSSKSHNQQFDDAVMIAGIVNAFYSDKYPLGRKKIQKLLYLVRRKEQADISSFRKKAAGPYADTIRYRGGEPIAKNNGYIQETKGKKGSSFSKGDRIQQALDYLTEWNKKQDIDWLVSEFKYTKVDELELLATVDMAACDLYQEGKAVTVQTIKNLIQSTKEWSDKLKKDYFSDMDIQRALKKCREMFNDTF